MFDPSSKTPPKLPDRKNGISNGKTNHRPSSRCATSTYKEKVTAMPSNKVSACPVSPNELAARKAYDNQIKMKLMDLAPRNPAKETSKGVQEFIKHVSDFIEKKNPFKETVVFSPARPRRKEVNTASINSIQFNGARKKLGEKKKTEDVIMVTNKPTVDKNPPEKQNPAAKPNPTPQKIESIGVKGRTSRPMSVARKRDEEKKYQRGYSPPRKRSESTPGKNLTEGSNWYRENKAEVKSSRQPPQRPVKPCTPVIQSQNKSKRPSEIPLRKNRTDLAKKPNTVSLLMQKPLKDVESESSVDIYTKDDLFPAMEDFGLCSEVQMTINFSSERLSTPGVSQILSTSEEESDSTSKSPGISIFEEFTEEKSASGKKSKVIDVGKVKTSSFTVIRTSSAVLTKLESLHKQNVNAREKSLNEKASSKQKAVAPKSSVNSLKGKCSKKSLYSRTSNKGNKPGLKTKTKKPKKEEISGVEDLKIAKKPLETKAQAPYHKFCREVVSECQKTDNKQKKDENQPPARKSLYNRSNSQRKPTNPKPKEELEKPTNTQMNPKPELENHKLEKPKITRNPSLIRRPSKPFLKISNSEEKQVKVVEILKPEKEVPTTPPPTPETAQTTVISGIHCEQTEEDEDWSAKTMMFGATNDKFHWCGISSEEKSESEESRVILLKSQPSSIESVTSTKPKKLDLMVKGTPLTFIKDSSDNTKDSEQPAVKKHLMIDLRTQEDTIEYRVVEENSAAKSLHDLVPGREEKCEEASCDFASSSDAGKEVRKNENKNFAHDLRPTKPRSPSLILSKPRKSFSSLKRKPQYKLGTKIGRKKKIRSDAGDRPMPFARNIFDSKTKIKPEAKLRSGLTKPTKRDEKHDVFEDAYEVKLRRRNSEPISFRGYVWKRTDSTTPRGHEASVSSMTSSLRHLNTDDIDDFILWEAIPQKMTSCWEMSLYHIRRPWSVLSCSVFKDNRMSSTPGLILKNLRNDSRRATIIQNERSTCRKENPFDVEPSIAQKNIDIRNWLAALNFPTPPSTSTDGFNEGNYHTQLSLDTQNLNKVQVNQKRRKVLSGLKFSEEVVQKKIEEKEKHRKFSKWNSSDGEGLTDLIRRKSGGFVTKEQFLNSEHSSHRPNVTVNLCVYSKSAEDSFLVETNDRSTTCEPRKYKSVEVTTQPEVSISATIISPRSGVGDQAMGKVLKVKEKPQEVAKPDEDTLVAFLKQEMNLFFSDVNIWKYLFLLTLCIVVIHYCYCNSYMYRH